MRLRNKILNSDVLTGYIVSPQRGEMLIAPRDSTGVIQTANQEHFWRGFPISSLFVWKTMTKIISTKN